MSEFLSRTIRILELKTFLDDLIEDKDYIVREESFMFF